jgi:hypothetical protein
MRMRSRLPQLKELVVEASHALAHLDAARLEELALSCQALNRELPLLDSGDRSQLASQAREASQEMEIFARVLEATRSNLNVMKRLHELRDGRLEYGGVRGSRWTGAEIDHGHD